MRSGRHGSEEGVVGPMLLGEARLNAGDVGVKGGDGCRRGLYNSAARGGYEERKEKNPGEKGACS